MRMGEVTKTMKAEHFTYSSQALRYFQIIET